MPCILEAWRKFQCEVVFRKRFAAMTQFLETVGGRKAQARILRQERKGFLAGGERPSQVACSAQNHDPAEMSVDVRAIS